MINDRGAILSVTYEEGFDFAKELKDRKDHVDGSIHISEGNHPDLGGIYIIHATLGGQSIILPLNK